MVDDTIQTPPPLTMRAALRRIWQADKYPILGNEDWRHAAILDREALEATATALPSPADPPEFAVWIAALRNPRLANDEREAIMFALHDLFDPETA